MNTDWYTVWAETLLLHVWQKRSQCTDIPVQVYTISIKISAKLIFIVSEPSQKICFWDYLDKYTEPSASWPDGVDTGVHTAVPNARPLQQTLYHLIRPVLSYSIIAKNQNTSVTVNRSLGRFTDGSFIITCRLYIVSLPVEDIEVLVPFVWDISPGLKL